MKSQNSNKIDIDVVFTWVDGNDVTHKTKLNQYLSENQQTKKNLLERRFGQVNEIEFAVKSVLKYAPFVRNIFIVTDNQTPAFLKNSNDTSEFKNVKIIDHSLIFRGYEEFLPTFNARSIESLLYKIPDLAEHFLYINDDVFLLNHTKPTDFFKENKVVLRGTWLTYDENQWYKNIFKFLFPYKLNNKRAGHKLAQQEASKILGFSKYYKFHHTPHPLRKSTFDNYFKHHPEVLIKNIQHKFRNVLQYTPQGLANHLEIKNNASTLINKKKLLYIGSYAKPKWIYKLKLYFYDQLTKNLFLNLQNLSECRDEKLDFFKDWLKKKYA